MTSAILLLLVVLLVAMVLFWFEWVPADVTALGLLVALVALRLVPPEEAFSGFGSETVLLLLGLFVMTAALQRTGVVDVVGRRLLALFSQRPRLLLPGMMLAVAAFSAAISNTAAAAFFLPVVLGLSRRSGSSASRLLLPMAFAAILSSPVTLISTSTNLVVSGLIVQGGLEPIGLFELTPVGLTVVAVGVAYMTTVGRRLLPDRPSADTIADRFELRRFLAELHVAPDSPLVGRTLGEARLGEDHDLTVLRLVRADGAVAELSVDTVLAAGDRLLTEGSSDAVVRAGDIRGLALEAGAAGEAVPPDGPGLGLAEVVVLQGSRFVGRSPRGLRLRERHGVQVLAISRRTSVLRSQLADTRLRLGDVLLVQGQDRRIVALRQSGAFDVLGMPEPVRLQRRDALVVVVLFGGSLVLGTSGLLPLATAVLLGAVLVFVARIISPEEAYRRVEWRVLVLIASMLGLGVAMQSTGTAAYLAEQLAALVGDLDPLWLLTGFFLLTVVLTQPMSNQAAAAVVVPLALETATQIGANPRSFAMMIAVAASTSYLTPLEPACLMVYGPGRYRFSDFLRVGGPLTALVYGTAIVLVPVLWPLAATS